MSYPWSACWLQTNIILVIITCGHLLCLTPASWHTYPRVQGSPCKKQVKVWEGKLYHCCNYISFLGSDFPCMCAIMRIQHAVYREIRKREFHSMFFSYMMFNLQKLFFFFSCYFCSLSVPLLLLYILKGLRQDIILLHFYGGNHAKPWFTQGTIMLLESLVKIKTTRPQVLKKVTNIALVPFCIHHEHTDACPEGHSGSGRDNDAQKLLSFLVSQMHRKLSSCCLYVLLKRCSVQSIAEHQYSTCETAYI